MTHLGAYRDDVVEFGIVVRQGQICSWRPMRAVDFSITTAPTAAGCCCSSSR
ncbi:hypothetical protein M8494_09180 [Serratia ureilytica]